MGRMSVRWVPESSREMNIEFPTHVVWILRMGYEESVRIACRRIPVRRGIGSYATLYGLMVDNAVGFESASTDGEVQMIDECNDPDLFWAIRGGGGGTYTALTKFRFQVYPSVAIHTYNLWQTSLGWATIAIVLRTKLSAKF